MNNPISKTLRYLRREYPATSSTTAIFAAGGLGMGALFACLGGPLVLLPAVTLFCGGWGYLCSMVSETLERGQGNAKVFNGTKLVGSRRDIASIHMTQELISEITKDLQHLPELPSRVDRHVSDMRKSFNRVRAYTTEGKPASEFSFTRQVINASGNVVQQPLVTLKMPA